MYLHSCILRVPDQNGVSLLCIMLEIHHSGREPSICESKIHVNVYSNLYKQKFINWDVFLIGGALKESLINGFSQ